MNFIDTSTASELYLLANYGMAVIACLVFLALFFITAPYGRHERTGWGPVVDSRIGWFVMESPASLIMLAAFFVVDENLTIFLLLAIWQIHYFHRAFIYPFTLQPRTMPVVIALMAVLFNTLNAGLNGWHFLLFADWYTSEWLYSPQFLVGSGFFFGGFYMTKRSDSILKELRTPGMREYKIPEGFLYRWVSCPNYLGECVQWFGWFLMTLSPAGLVFFIWTVANLVPRAISHHRWYRETFEKYPADRKAILPGIL